MPVIAFIIQKGGIGKSTLARLVAREYASARWRVKIAGPPRGTTSGLRTLNCRAGTGRRTCGEDKADVLAFLDSLTDRSILHNPRLADPWHPQKKRQEHTSSPEFATGGGAISGEVLAAYLEAGSVVLQYAGRSMEFLVPDASAFRVLKPGKKIGARARKRGHDTIVEDPRPQ